MLVGGKHLRTCFFPHSSSSLDLDSSKCGCLGSAHSKYHCNYTYMLHHLLVSWLKWEGSLCTVEMWKVSTDYSANAALSWRSKSVGDPSPLTPQLPVDHRWIIPIGGWASQHLKKLIGTFHLALLKQREISSGHIVVILVSCNDTVVHSYGRREDIIYDDVFFYLFISIHLYFFSTMRKVPA